MTNSNDTYNKGGFYAFVFCMVFSFLFFIYISFIHPGVDLKEIAPEQSGEATQTVAGGTKAADISKIANYWEPNDEMVLFGKQAYAANCAVCHGPQGKGDGPGGASLNPHPRNFVEGKWTKGGDSISLFKTITHGIDGTSMAPFGHLKIEERWGLVQFIHSITQNKVKDDAAKLEAFAKTAK